jgi:hypothetical protein
VSIRQQVTALPDGVCLGNVADRRDELDGALCLLDAVRVAENVNFAPEKPGHAGEQAIHRIGR